MKNFVRTFRGDKFLKRVCKLELDYVFFLLATYSVRIVETKDALEGTQHLWSCYLWTTRIHIHSDE